MDWVRLSVILICFGAGALCGLFYGRWSGFAAFRAKHKILPHLLPMPVAVVGLIVYVVFVFLKMQRASGITLCAILFVIGFSWGGNPAFTGYLKEWFKPKE
jgi:hypothetical protein